MRYCRKSDGKVSAEDAKRIVESVAASNRLEGIDTPQELQDMLFRRILGEVSDEEYMDWVLSRAGVEK